MKNFKLYEVETRKGIARFYKYIVPSHSDEWDVYDQERSNLNFHKALRKASKFVGRGLTTRGDHYGRAVDNGMSVYGRFELRKV